MGFEVITAHLTLIYFNRQNTCINVAEQAYKIANIKQETLQNVNMYFINIDFPKKTRLITLSSNLIYFVAN